MSLETLRRAAATALLLVGSAASAAGRPEPEDFKATRCAPEGSVWLEAVRENFRRQSLQLSSDILIELPEDPSRQGEIRIDELMSSKSEPGYPIRNLTSVAWTGLSPELARFAQGGYYAFILPPGANDALFPHDPGLDTGRAGAIFLVPYDPAQHCDQLESPGLLIHAGPAQSVALLGRLPSLVMGEEQLSRLIGEIVSLHAGARKRGVPYEVAIAGLSLHTGQAAFGPFLVKIERRERTFLEWLTGSAYGKNVGVPPKASLPIPPAPATLPFKEVAWMHRRVLEGTAAYLLEFLDKIEAFEQGMAQFEAVRHAVGNPELLKARMAQLNASHSELLVFVPEFQRILEEEPGVLARDPQALVRYKAQVADFAEQLRAYTYELPEVNDELLRLEPARYLDVQKDSAAPAVPTPSCVLESWTKQLAPQQVVFAGRSLSISGRVAFRYEPDTAGQNLVRLAIRSYLDVTPLKPLIRSVVEESVPASSCSNRYSLSDLELVATGAGTLNGRAGVRYELHSCATFRYPCWVNWKTYSCKKTASTRLLGHTVRKRFTISSRHFNAPDGEPTLELSVNGPMHLREKFTPLTWDEFRPLGALDLGLAFRDSEFTQTTASDLAFVTELASKRMPHALACATQRQLKP